MKTLTLFCNKHNCFLLILFFIFSSSANAQTNSKTDTSIVLITAVLKDETKIWGTLYRVDDSILVVFDFNLGQIYLSKKNIKSEEREKLNKAIVVETINNASYFGTITGASAKTILMQSALLGTFEIQSNSITKITSFDEFVNRRGAKWFANPNATRYFFAPSAIPLKKKEGYYQNAYLLANSVNIGLSNNVTLGGGVVIPLLFYVTPKISYNIYKNLYIGAGILFTQSFITDFELSAGIGYGLITIGNQEHNFTLGSGYGFSKFDSSYRATKMPIVTLNGMTRLGKRVSLVTENWLIPRASYQVEQTFSDPNNGMPYTESVKIKKDFYTPAASFGVRLMPGVKTSIDFSVVGIKTNPYQNYLFLPYLDFVYKFN